ncbi:hypothetical protein [Streptomyces sp. A3M-1-3]|uniref:hypothetical protein n=1 Tax=Streptomyces sp. A3M-1-3 TaxID=2962044 RepID=UPI0027E59293|nr:hypothetical protein [Streptomyces sp. A3M-1-3]
MLRAARTPPRTALFVSGEGADGYAPGLALRDAAKPPTTVYVKKTRGGHTSRVWRTALPEVFTRLSGQLRPGQLRP